MHDVLSTILDASRSGHLVGVSPDEWIKAATVSSGQVTDLFESVKGIIRTGWFDMCQYFPWIPGCSF